jgi:hypothetical protein
MRRQGESAAHTGQQQILLRRKMLHVLDEVEEQRSDARMWRRRRLLRLALLILRILQLFRCPSRLRIRWLRFGWLRLGRLRHRDGLNGRG